MVHEQRGVLTRITFTNTTLLPRKFRDSLSMPGSLQPDGIGVANEFQRSGVISIIRPSTKPDAGDHAEQAEGVWICAVTRLRSRPVAKELLIGDNVLEGLTNVQGPKEAYKQELRQ
jgi:hypothetical protein